MFSNFRRSWSFDNFSLSRLSLLSILHTSLNRVKSRKQNYLFIILSFERPRMLSVFCYDKTSLRQNIDISSFCYDVRFFKPKEKHKMGIIGIVSCEHRCFSILNFQKIKEIVFKESANVATEDLKGLTLLLDIATIFIVSLAME